MHKFSVDFFKDHIKSDNTESLVIYKDLAQAFHSSLSTFPKNENIIGVYFFDILKLLTLILLKDREVNLGVDPTNKEVHKRLNTWPYIGYEDISKGVDYENKVFGKANSVKPTVFQQNLQRVINFKYCLGKKYKKKISLTSLRIARGEILFSLQSSELKANLISAEKGWFSVPHLSSQLELLRSIIIKILETNNYPISSKIVAEILVSHIKADCYEGPINFRFDGDILLLNSGVELHNRMMAIAALNQGIPVINIQHGEAFGIYDEPAFGDLGEAAYANTFLGYGYGALHYQDNYKFGLIKNIKYISSNGSNVKKLYYPEFRGVSSENKKIKFFYFPTTLSGHSHRYGPYRDTPDYLYLSWQDFLINLFRGKLIVKNHPKEKYSSSYGGASAVKRVTGSLSELLEEIDVFVFDYIGTAFNEACATNKPVIYFDLGIRNIAPNVLSAVKDRTIYYDIKKGMPSFPDIEEKLYFGEVSNDYSLKYSLSGNDKSRTQSLSEGIIRIYG